MILQLVSTIIGTPSFKPRNCPGTLIVELQSGAHANTALVPDEPTSRNWDRRSALCVQLVKLVS
mgnify:FL=1